VQLVQGSASAPISQWHAQESTPGPRRLIARLRDRESATSVLALNFLTIVACHVALRLERRDAEDVRFAKLASAGEAATRAAAAAGSWLKRLRLRAPQAHKWPCSTGGSLVIKHRLGVS